MDNFEIAAKRIAEELRELEELDQQMNFTNEEKNIMKTATTTVQNGNKKVTITVSEGEIWEKEGVSRIYYDITQDNKRNVLGKFYQVLSGTTKDDMVEIGGRVFGYQLGGSCDSKSKRVAAKGAVLDIVNTLMS